MLDWMKEKCYPDDALVDVKILSSLREALRDIRRIQRSRINRTICHETSVASFRLGKNFWTMSLPR